MHEFSVVVGLLDEVVRRTERHPGAIVRRIEVRVGESSGVDADLFLTAFEQLRPGSPCANAELALARVPAVWQCPRCERRFATGHLLLCNHCNLPGRLLSGGELMLDRIELEVPDV